MFAVGVVCGCGASGRGGFEFLVGLFVGVSNPLFSVSVFWVSLFPPVRSLLVLGFGRGPELVCGLCSL